MQLPSPVRAPAFRSRRNLFERSLSDLHKCTDLNHLKQLHALIYKAHLHRDPYIAPKLISALSLCSRMSLAINVFDQIPCPNAHLCNALIKAFARNSEPNKAFEVFLNMQRLGISPDNYTYFFLLQACSQLKFVKLVHACVEKLNLHPELFVFNALIDAYARCRSIGGSDGVQFAKKVFDAMETKDVVSYNSMIGVLVKSGELKDAKKLFDEMPQRDKVSWNSILNAYVKAGEMSSAFEIFQQMPSRDVVSWSTLISGYTKTGDLEMAKAMFDSMPTKNFITWTIMISGYAQKGFASEAIWLYNEMEARGLDIDDGTLVSILSASSESGLLDLGKKVHYTIMKNQYQCSTLVSNALIDMYCKCGSLKTAWRIFNTMQRRDLVSWNAMIHGVAMHRHGWKAIELFERMKREGFVPDKLTFVGVLSGCSRSGIVKDGIRYFHTMESNYGITPEIEHYGCLIDLLGRGGYFKEIFGVLYEMPFEPNFIIWSSVLAACRMHGAVELAEVVLDRLMKLEDTDAGELSMLSKMFGATWDWGSVGNARLQMKTMIDRRATGVSLVHAVKR